MPISTTAANRIAAKTMNHSDGLRISSTSSPSRRMWRVSSAASEVASGARLAAVATPPSLAAMADDVARTRRRRRGGSPSAARAGGSARNVRGARECSTAG